MFLECWEIWFLLPEGFLKYMLDSVGTGGFNMDTTQTWTPGTDKGNGQGERTGTPGILAWTWMLFMDMETGHGDWTWRLDMETGHGDWTWT
jgi:hypothetical protein